MKRVAISLLLVTATVAAAAAWSWWGHRRAIDQAGEAENALAMSSQAVEQVRERRAHPLPTDPAVVASKRADRMVAESEADNAPHDR